MMLKLLDLSHLYALYPSMYEKHEIEVRNNYTEKFVEFPIS